MMTTTTQSQSRPITPAQRRELERNAAATQQAMERLLAASPALKQWMEENYRAP